jgi:hypothetical protein
MTTFTKTLAAAALACSLALTASTGASAAAAGSLSGLKAAAPQSAVVDVRGRHHHHHHGRNVALGILGAAAATAIVAGAARADGRRYRRGESCEYLDYKCSQGHGWACRKYEYRCED